MIIKAWLLLSALSLSPNMPGEASSLSRARDKVLDLPSPQLFAEGVVSGPGNDGSPTFSPDGNTIFFTRSAAQWTVILESHRVHGAWTKAIPAEFSGEWPDSSPAMSPDGSYIVFQSTRPVESAKKSQAAARPVSNLWRVDQAGSGWSKPTRLPDAVNIGHSIWKPSVQANGTVYFTFIDPTGKKRLFSSMLVNGAYQAAQPLPFSDGNSPDVDPEVAPDGSFLVFCSAGRVAGDTKDHLFIVRRNGQSWGDVVRIRYTDDGIPEGGSTDDEPHLGPDHRTLYFSSDRIIPVRFPRTREQALKDIERVESWDSGNTNVWSISIYSWL
jgi:Tol biopolymer transport system component